MAYRIDTKKKKINYKLRFKYNGEEISQTINLKELEKEGSLIVNGSANDYIITLQLLTSGVLGLRVETIFNAYICTFQLTELDIKFV
jgi:hypothetical protein